MGNYIKRIIEKEIEEELELFGAVLIEGPKWCGKTTTASKLSNSQFFLGDPSGNFQNRQLAENLPEFVFEGEKPRLIDEWQMVPTLWDGIRYYVDNSKIKGNFILTGSTSVDYSKVFHSGAGRISKIKMRTLSLYESGFSTGDISLEDLCNEKFKAAKTGEVDIEKLADYICRGGWPGNLYTASNKITSIPRKYVDTIVSVELASLNNISFDNIKLELLLKSLARNESTTVSNNSLINDISSNDNKKIDESTISKYLKILDILFVFDNTLAFSTNSRSSITLKQQAKRRFCDPSLAAALLKLTPSKLINDLNTFGFLFESLVERDLKIYAESFGGEIYHYKNYKNQEIDIVIKLEDGSWCAFEVKLGTSKIDEAASNLLKIKKTLEDAKDLPPKILCVISGLTSIAYQRPDGVFVIPITALKN